MKIVDIDMQAIDKAIQSLKGEREDNDQFNAGMYYIRDLIEPYYDNLVKENKRLNDIIINLDKMFEYYYLGNYKYNQDTVNEIYIKYIKLKEMKEGK